MIFFPSTCSERRKKEFRVFFFCLKIVEIHTGCQQWRYHARCTYMHICLQTFASSTQSWSSVVSVLILTDCARLAQERFTAYCYTLSQYFIMVAMRLWRNARDCLRPGSAESSENRCSDSWLRGWSWPGELSCERVWWTGVFWTVIAGRRLLADLAWGETQEERWRLRWSRWWFSFSRSCSLSKLKLLQEPRLQRRYRRNCWVQPYFFLKTLRAPPTWIAGDVRRNSMARKRISSSGRGRLRHSSLDWSRNPIWCWSGLRCRRWKSRQSSSIRNFCRSWRTRSAGMPTWSLCCSRCTQCLWTSRVEKRKTLLPTRGRTPWSRGDDCRRDLILQQEEGRETFFVLSFLRNDALFSNSKRELNAGSLLCRSTRRSRRIRWTTRSSWPVWRRWCQRRLRHIWFSTPTAFELLKMRVAKSSRTWRSSLVLKIRDSKPSDTVLRGLERSTLSLSLVSWRKRVIRFACWVF